MRVITFFDSALNLLTVKNIPSSFPFSLLLILIVGTHVFAQSESMSGMASYYGNEFQGKKTASGEKYDKRKYTAAHRTYTFGTKLKVTNLATGKAVLVKVNDRGPYSNHRIIDLSYAAAKDLGMIASGIIEVKIEIVPDKYTIPKSPTKKQSDHTTLSNGYYTKDLSPVARPSGTLLQVGSFSLYENALSRINELQGIKIGNPCIEIVTVRRKKVFRVLYSGFHSNEAIRIKQTELKKKGFDSIIIDAE